MIEVLADEVEKMFTATQDTLVQNPSSQTVWFQTNNAETIWGMLAPGQTLEVPNATVVYFKAISAVNLATVAM